VLIDGHAEIGSEFTSFMREFRDFDRFFTIGWIPHVDLCEEGFDCRFVIVVGV
jgi:hypothetical protein